MRHEWEDSEGYEFWADRKGTNASCDSLRQEVLRQAQRAKDLEQGQGEIAEAALQPYVDEVRHLNEQIAKADERISWLHTLLGTAGLWLDELEKRNHSATLRELVAQCRFPFKEGPGRRAPQEP